MKINYKKQSNIWQRMLETIEMLFPTEDAGNCMSKNRENQKYSKEMSNRRQSFLKLERVN